MTSVKYFNRSFQPYNGVRVLLITIIKLHRISACRVVFLLLLITSSNPLCALFTGFISLISSHQAENLFQHPVPYPAFINSVSPLGGKSAKQAKKGHFATPTFLNPEGPCVDIYGGADELWEPHDLPEKGYKFWRSHMTLTIDGQIIPVGKDQRFLGGGLYIIDRDAAGRITRSYTLSLLTCFDIDIPVGLHLATLILTTTSGKKLSYSWAFQINAEDS
jgi:hypothetical protein